MTKTINFKIHSIYLILLLLILFQNRSSSEVLNDSIIQEDTTATIDLSYFKVNGKSHLSAELYEQANEGNEPIGNATLHFYYQLGDSLFLINTISTNSEGLAICNLDGLDLVGDQEGFMKCLCSFSGNKQYSSARQQLIIKNLQISLSFQLIDTTKTIVIKGIESTGRGDQKVIDFTSVELFTPTLFGEMLIGSVEFMNGYATLDFPTDIPGDEEGNIEVIARIMENGNYGNLVLTSTKNWGKEFIPQMDMAHHKLWTTDPPVWMLISFIVLLGGVWSLYIIVFFKVRRMKKTGIMDINY